MTSPAKPPGEPLRVLHVISRLNTGGPAIQEIILTHRLAQHGYRTTLARGREEPGEGSMDHLADELGVEPVLIPWMRRNPGWRDFPALVALIRLIRRERPHIVHTHAAKAGALGRLAALIVGFSRHPRPTLIHTFHGHSLTGYFSSRTSAVYTWIEQLLARHTDRLIAVSNEVRDELASMSVAPACKFDVVPLGFDLSPFTVNGPARREMRAGLRAELGIPSDARLVTLIARLVPIKRVDRFLRMANRLSDVRNIRFMIVGDGELREELKASAEAKGLGELLIWAGMRRDMPDVCFSSDVVVQTSDNEGTPVSLIEAQAAGVPVVSTRVGGTLTTAAEAPLVDPWDEAGLAEAVRLVLDDRGGSALRAAAARKRVLAQFDLDRLVCDIAALYTAQLGVSEARVTPSAARFHAPLVSSQE